MLKSIWNGLKYGIKGNQLIIYSEWFLQAVRDLAPLLFSVIWASLIDTAVKGIQEGNISFQLMMIPFVLYGGVEIIKSLMTRLNDYVETRVFDQLETKVHTEITNKYSSLDIQSLEDPEVNRLFQIVRGDYMWRIRYLVLTFGRCISALLLLLLSSIIIIKISPIVMVIIFLTAIPSVVANMKFGSVSWGIWHEEANKQRKFNLVQEFLLNKENLIEASVNNISPYLVNVIKRILDDYHQRRIPMLRKRLFATLFTDTFTIVGSVASVYFLINSALQGEISIGSLILGASVFVSFSSSLGTFLYEVTEIYNSGLFMRDFLSFMGLKPKVKIGGKLLEKLENPPKIEFKNVSFKYPNTSKLILKDIDLTINPGMKVALVGENGVGKTTLIKILARFYELEGGQILIDGYDLSDIETESWEQNIGLLTQHFNTYPAFNVAENIYFGEISRKKNKKEMLEAAKNANVSSFTQKYKDKFEQQLSIQFEGGVDPSWGQWQRIGIARTLYRNPSIIIFDEPTSAIDAQAEYEIFQNINKHTAGKTVIYVSHRYSTVRNADLICVLKEGKIVESGNHATLLKLNGEYAKNFKLQAEGYN